MNSKLLKHVEIADQLRARIADGTYRPGDLLPTLVELVNQHGCAQETARKAVQTLVAERLVVARRGTGTVVRDQRPVALGHKAGNTPGTWAAQAGEGAVDEVVSGGWVEATEDIADRLAINPGDRVFHRVRHLRLSGNSDLAMTIRQWVRGDVADAVIAAGHDLVTEVGNIYVSTAKAGFVVDRVKETLSARPGDVDELDQFTLPDGAAVLVTERVSLTADGTPVETATTTAAGDRLSASYEVSING